MDSAPFGVYVHIPFCAKKCDYCAFATWTDRAHLITDYVTACVAEVEQAKLPPATSVFFGGGTPSLIPPDELTRILMVIDRSDGAEVTVECNPDTVTPEHFAVYADAGVNRVSLGVQSAVPRVLRSLGRTHNRDNVVRAVAMAAEAGIERVNVDIIYGAAGESLADWQATVEWVLALSPQPTHVSAYGLTVEAGTPLAGDHARHPDDDDQADKYLLADDLLMAEGLVNYEVSNWAVPGHESRHNFLYWRQQNYRGIGCAAHSHEDGRRWWNLRTPERYITAVNAGQSTVAAEEVLDESTRRFEELELLLRTNDGVPLETLQLDGLDDFVVVDRDRIRLTRQGKLVANSMAARLIVD